MIIDTDLLLCWGAIQRKIEKGRVIFCEGEEPHFYYQLVSGQVEMVNTSPSGKEFIQGIFGPGDSFGEPAVLTEQPFPASAVAIEDCVLLRMPRERFIQLLKDNPDVHFAFTRLLSERLRQKSILSKEICFHEPATLIRGLLERHAVCNGDTRLGRLRVFLTRQQIADMTGLRVETVIRIIRSMYKRGDLVLEKGKVYV